MGLGMSPEAPPVPPAPGGRAPSFGAPLPPEKAAFRFGGSIFAWEAVGLGREPEITDGQDPDTVLHVPALVQGRQPFWPQTGARLFLQYGTGMVTGTVTVNFGAPGRERRNFFQSVNGFSLGQAYLTLTPPALGKLHLAFRVGAFTENFAGPGLWGWGIFGPMIAIRGYGESTFADYDLTRELRLQFEHGVLAVPGVPEEFPRGNYTGWTETGVSTFVHHAHAGFTYKNQYTFRLHWARADGTDERRYLVPEARDGHMDAYVAEGRVLALPYGQLGVSGAFWNFDGARAVHDGIWWGVDWTKGAQDFMRNYLGPAAIDPNGQGDGQVAAISAQYDVSLAQLAWHPRPFDGRAPDIRVAVAGVHHWTLDTEDERLEGASGYLLGAEVHYQALRWFGATVRSYGESRMSALGRWQVYSVSPGLVFRSDWQSTDRIEIIYTRRFYNDVADNNPAQPLDRDIVSLGAYVDF